MIVAGTGNEPPTYARFPMTQGLCGAAAETRETLIVGDVRKDARWLPTFFTTESEIVVPITSESNGRVLGIIDVESEKLNAFHRGRSRFLEHVAVLMARKLCTAKRKRMLPRVERVLSEWLASGARGIGQVLIAKPAPVLSSVIARTKPASSWRFFARLTTRLKSRGWTMRGNIGP